MISRTLACVVLVAAAGCTSVLDESEQNSVVGSGSGSGSTTVDAGTVGSGSDAGSGSATVDAGSGSGSGSGSDPGGGSDVGGGDGSDCDEGTGNTYSGTPDDLGDKDSIPGMPPPGAMADIMDGHVKSTCTGYDIFGNVGAAAAGAKDGNCHNATLTSGVNAIVCGGDPFLTNGDPIAMAGNHTASWEYIAKTKVRFYSWSGQSGGKRYWTYQLPPKFDTTKAPDIQNAMFNAPTWPTPGNNGTNVYVAGKTMQGWIQAETISASTRGYCEGQFGAASKAMLGFKDMENPGPKIACDWLAFDPKRQSKNPNADCHNLCTGRSNAWAGWDYKKPFKDACDAACDVCLPAKPVCEQTTTAD